MPQQYPTRASLHRAPPSAAPPATSPFFPTGIAQDAPSTTVHPLPTRAERRQAEALSHRPASPWAPVPVETPPVIALSRAHRRETERRERLNRDALRRRVLPVGGVAAVVAGLLVATLSSGSSIIEAGEAPPNPAMVVHPLGDLSPLRENDAASRGGDRAPATVFPNTAPIIAAAETLSPGTIAAIEGAQEAMERAGHLLATETRTTPEQRTDIQETSAVLRELVALATEGQIHSPDDPEMVAAVDDALTLATMYLELFGAEEDALADLDTIAVAVNRWVIQLDDLIALAGPAEVSIDARDEQFLRFPLASWSVSSPFGYRRHPLFGGIRHHNGVDLRAQCGTHVFAAADGVVITSEFGRHDGNFIIIDHGYDLFGNRVHTMYSKLQSREVEVGAEVRQGQRIAQAGRTGTSTGCHLHFEVHVNGVLNDPVNWMPPHAGVCVPDTQGWCACC